MTSSTDNCDAAQEKQAEQSGRAWLAFFVIALGGPLLLGCGFMLLMVLSSRNVSTHTLMIGFLYLPLMSLLFGCPASITVGLLAAISVAHSGKIRITALLWGLLFVALGAAVIVGDQSSKKSLLDRYGLWYTLLAAIATTLIAWPAKKLCDAKPMPARDQAEGNR